MSKITLTDLVNLQNETSAVTNINSNNATLENAVDNTLSRDGTSPNQMGSNLDMNSHRIINLPAPVDPLEPVRVKDLTPVSTITVITSDVTSVKTFGASGSASTTTGNISSASSTLTLSN